MRQELKEELGDDYTEEKLEMGFSTITDEEFFTLYGIMDQYAIEAVKHDRMLNFDLKDKTEIVLP